MNWESKIIFLPSVLDKVVLFALIEAGEGMLMESKRKTERLLRKAMVLWKKSVLAQCCSNKTASSLDCIQVIGANYCAQER